MADDLFELHDRVGFARSEIRSLQETIRLFCATHVQVIDVPGPTFDTFNAILRQTAPVPVSISAKAGMIANELRSTLDGLACALAVRNGKTTSGTYFPISKTKEIFDEDGVKWKLKKLSEADRATIIDLKPYREANPILFGLHEADRTRKHTRLVAHAAANAGTSLGTAIASGGHHSLTIRGGNLDGRKVGLLHIYSAADILKQTSADKLLASGIPVGLPLTCTLGVAYAEPEDLFAQPVWKTLWRFSAEVDRIVSLFD